MFVFDWQSENKELIIMSAAGPAAEGRGDRFATVVKKHPEWSETQIKALDTEGAKFGPSHRAEFLQALPLQALRRFVGELEVVSADFHVDSSDIHGTGSRIDVSWIVKATWHGPDGRDAGCTLAFEPFDGRLTMIRRDFSTHNETRASVRDA
jgi:hypothetical protein